MTKNQRVYVSLASALVSAIAVVRPTASVSRERAAVATVAGLINTYLLYIGK
jgi:hypothetical protein